MTDSAWLSFKARLSKSPFRSRFHLKDKDIAYAREKGRDKIESHAYDFITLRLAPKDPKNDGKQTPMKGHPVFIAQHATALCCRSCAEKWHHIPKDREMNKDEIDYAVSVIMHFIDDEISLHGGWST